MRAAEPIRLVYYTVPSFLVTALPLVRALSRRVALHVIMEIAPESWNSGLFDVAPRALPSGIVAADPVLRDCFPPGVRSYWENCASFDLVVHNTKTFRPATWGVSRQVMRHIKGIQPHLLHMDAGSLRLAPALVGLGGVPLVLAVHDPTPHSGEHSWRTDLTRWLTFSRTQHFVLYNQEALPSFAATHRIPPGHLDATRLGSCEIYREWGDASAREGDRTVLFFGRLSPYKGLEYLYLAAGEIARQVPGLRLVVAGKPVAGYTPPVQPELPNGGQVQLIDGYISNSRLAELCQQATVVVCPYVDATQSAVVLTAYAFRKPVVATRVGGIPEYVEDGATGYLVPPRDPGALAEAVVKVLRDPQRRQQMSEQIELWARTRLSWDRIGDEILETYRRVLDRQGGRD